MAEAVAGDEPVGIVGAIVFGPTVPVMGSTPAVGIAAAELTPRLAISVESSGSAARRVVVVDDVDVGGDAEATLLEPEPQIPNCPAVAGIPEVIDNPEVADTPAAIPDVAVLLEVAVAVGAAVAGGVAPLSVWPPPS
jgi:hypothetical protein